MSDLTPATRKELEEQRDVLRRKIAALDEILGQQSNENGVQAATQTTRTHAPRSTGLRGRIYAVLGDHPAGLKPAEVATALTEGGFEYHGATPLNLRVANELHRLLKKDRLHRTNGGKYKLKD